MKQDKNIKMIKIYIYKKYENMSDKQKQKLKDYQKEYYKKYYAEKKLKMILSHR